MTELVPNLRFDDVQRIETISRLIFELRRNYKVVLQKWGVASEAELLEKIASGVLDEHPAYEDYLSVRILDETREALREELKSILCGVKPA